MTPVILTITPGSDLDKAIDAVVDFELGEGPIPSKEVFGLIDPANSGHMVAIGCRQDCRLRGKSDPSQLTHDEYHGWYGKKL
jgi:hypothetical protein